MVEDAAGKLIMAKCNLVWHMESYGISKDVAHAIAKQAFEELKDKELLTNALCVYLDQNPKTL